MSASASPRFTRRVLRVRNACLGSLAKQRGLPVPGGGEIADDMTLARALSAWTMRNTPPETVAEPAVPTVSRWRSPRTERWMLLALVGVFGFVVGNQWLPRAEAQTAFASTVEHWIPVTDSAVATLNGKLLQLGQIEVGVPLELSPAEAAALVLGPEARGDSLVARIDSVLWIRGALRDGTPVEVHGKLRVREAGFGELRVAADSSRIPFELPSFVSALWLAEGKAHLLARSR